MKQFWSQAGRKHLTRAETVKSLACIFSVNQSTFLLVLRKMTAWVMVSVSYRSHRVSSFHSCKWLKKTKKKTSYAKHVS